MDIRTWTRRGVAVLGVGLGCWAWWPQLHRHVAWDPKQGRPQLLNGVMAPWRDPQQLEAQVAAMQKSNAEWDFMGRTFLVWALADDALAHPEAKADHLAVMDRIIDETLKLEQSRGLYYFLMPYAHDKPWVQTPAASQFLDGEIALMLAARRAVEEKPAYQPLLQARVDAIARRMAASPSLSAESYPDECWTFCNSIALAATALADALDGTDHSALREQWVTYAKAHLIEPRTGLLVSSYALDGKVQQGPEGSSIWMAAHMLQFFDPAFARDQYQRAKAALGVEFLGFGFSREWPAEQVGNIDVDSGLTVPILGASPSASGMAMMAARSFGDAEYGQALDASIGLGGFPVRDGDSVRFLASNAVGDAVLLYATGAGPLVHVANEGKRGVR